jgi:beta-galactosidase
MHTRICTQQVLFYRKFVVTIKDVLGRHHGGNVTEMKRQCDQNKSKVNLFADGIYIEGKPRIILCSSVFYFRIPRDEWRDRLEKVKAAGYNCIDIYFPWNYHEAEEGKWEFEDEKDVEAYLALATELGLWVIARPGPYICSEWDMGGLPAYLLAKEGLILREYNEPYLKFVKKWYERIMPLIVKYQLGKQGTVIAVQIENELDFYDCRQTELYIGKLRDYALEAGVIVPLVVCAGQCDVVRAGGLVEGVIPTLNFYPELTEKTLEDRIHHYVETFREQDLPFCITETSPSHVILRREFGAGAKFIAPYNQVSGTNFGFTPSVNNWGFPLAFLPHDYNLKGMVNPQGECTSEYGEAFLFSGLLKSFEDALGTSSSRTEKELQITGECMLSSGIHRTLHLANGGKLAAIANVDDKPGKVCFTYEGKSRPSYTEFTAAALTCPILPFDIPFCDFGLSEEDGKLAYSTAEIAHIDRQGNTTYVLFYTDTQAELALQLKDTAKVVTKQMELHHADKLSILTYSTGQTASAEVIFASGKRLCLYGVSRNQAIELLMNRSFPWEKNYEAEAAVTAEANADSEVAAVGFGQNNREMLKIMNGMTYFRYPVAGMGQNLSGDKMLPQDGCPAMEDMNYSRGFGWYEAKASLQQGQKNLGYMIYNGMDVIHLYRNNEYLDSYIGDGNHVFIREPKADTGKCVQLGVRCEIWGHSNFSDSRLQAMDIRCKKGIQGLSIITSMDEITENWCYCKDEMPEDSVSLLSDQDKFRPLITFGVYNNPDQPQIGVYKKKIKLHPDNDSLVLELKNFNSSAKVFADGIFVKTIQPFDSTVTLDHICGKEEMELSILLVQKTIQESMKVRINLYEGKHVTDVVCYGADEKKLAAYTRSIQASHTDEQGITLLQKTAFHPGEMAVLAGDFVVPEAIKQSLRLKITGKDAKVLVLLNGIMLGRIWLSSETTGPFFKGGDASILFLPKSFIQVENRLDLLVEAMQGEPCIEKLEYEIVRDR